METEKRSFYASPAGDIEVCIHFSRDGIKSKISFVEDTTITSGWCDDYEEILQIERKGIKICYATDNWEDVLPTEIPFQVIPLIIQKR